MKRRDCYLSALLLALMPKEAMGQYPKELVPKTEFTIVEEGEGSAGYSMTGSYSVV